MCRVATLTVLLWTTVGSCLAGETTLMDSWGWRGRRAPSLCEGGREGGMEGGREGGMEGGREGGRKGWRKGGKGGRKRS